MLRGPSSLSMHLWLPVPYSVSEARVAMRSSTVALWVHLQLGSLASLAGRPLIAEYRRMSTGPARAECGPLTGLHNWPVFRRQAGNTSVNWWADQSVCHTENRESYCEGLLSPRRGTNKADCLAPEHRRGHREEWSELRDHSAGIAFVNKTISWIMPTYYYTVQDKDSCMRRHEPLQIWHQAGKDLD